MTIISLSLKQKLRQKESVAHSDAREAEYSGVARGIDEYLALCLSSGEHLRYSTKHVALVCTHEAVKYEHEHL
jgi:hypothetical protein